MGGRRRGFGRAYVPRGGSCFFSEGVFEVKSFGFFLFYSFFSYLFILYFFSFFLKWRQHQVYLLGSKEVLFLPPFLSFPFFFASPLPLQSLNWTMQSILSKTKAKLVGLRERKGEELNEGNTEEGSSEEGEGTRPLTRFCWEVGMVDEEKEERKSKVSN